MGTQPTWNAWRPTCRQLQPPPPPQQAPLAAACTAWPRPAAAGSGACSSRASRRPTVWTRRCSSWHIRRPAGKQARCTAAACTVPAHLPLHSPLTYLRANPPFRCSCPALPTAPPPAPPPPARSLLVRCKLEGRFYDLIDSDSFGAAAHCVGAALDAVRFGGLVCLTSTSGAQGGLAAWARLRCRLAAVLACWGAGLLRFRLAAVQACWEAPVVAGWPASGRCVCSAHHSPACLPCLALCPATCRHHCGWAGRCQRAGPLWHAPGPGAFCQRAGGGRGAGRASAHTPTDTAGRLPCVCVPCIPQQRGPPAAPAAPPPPAAALPCPLWWLQGLRMLIGLAHREALARRLT